MKKYGSNIISIKTIGYKRSTFTVILDCMVNKLKLPPVVTFKLKNIFWKIFSDNIFVRTNVKRWINKNEIIW